MYKTLQRCIFCFKILCMGFFVLKFYFGSNINQIWNNFIKCIKLTISLSRTHLRFPQTPEKTTNQLQCLVMPCIRKAFPAASSPRRTPGPRGPLHSWNSHHILYCKQTADGANWLVTRGYFITLTSFCFLCEEFFMNYLGKYKKDECTLLYKWPLYDLFTGVLHKL